MSRPVAIDLFCGLGGWAEGFLAEGWDVIGFDIERHRYWVPDVPEGGDGRKGTKPVEKRGWTQGCAVSLGLEGANAQPRTKLLQYPGQLVLQDVLTLDGAQFRGAACIVASPPCQEYSYMAMPWSRAKQIARALEGHGEFPEGYTGSRTVADLNALFDACFRIQREASEAAGRHIPLVVENVKGAQPWVGRAAWHYGSFYLWGDVPALMPFTAHRKVPGMNFHEHEKTGKPGRSFQSAAVDHMKSTGGSWFTQGNGARITRNDPRDSGVKQHGSGPRRKAASAMIAKIPFDLARWIAYCYHPERTKEAV